MTKWINIYSVFIVLAVFFIATNSLHSSFQLYCQKFNRNYDKEEFILRQKIYNQNMKYITHSNCKSLGQNNYTDWTFEEMKQKKGHKRRTTKNLDSISQLFMKGLNLPVKVPTAFDWRTKSAITTVKNQQFCGDCWAFSTTAFFQSDLIINQGYNRSIDLSQQYLNYCDNRSLGCDGGFPFWAMDKIISVGGMPNDTLYPYDYIFGPEDNMCFTKKLVKISQSRQLVSYYGITDQTFIKKVILKKPVNIAVCSADLQYYAPTQKVRTLFCNVKNTVLDHTVLLIGYTATEWIIKNQWGTDWGVGGFGYISRNQNNNCCIGQQLYTTAQVSKNCSIKLCQVCVQKTSCHKCVKGYYVQNAGATQTCVKCTIANCAQCLNHYGVCNYCNLGYSVSYPDYLCSKWTVPNCAFMYGFFCNECYPGYVLDDFFNCVKPTITQIKGIKHY